MAYVPSPLTLRALRLLSVHGFRSVAELARLLDASRPAVSKALEGVDGVGVSLIHKRGSGYQLGSAIDWLDPLRLAEHLGDYRDVYELRVVDIIESTNTTLLQEAVAGAAPGLMLAAELQTRGRGRRGRVWHSGLGGALTFSVLWRYDQGAGFLAGLGLAVGLALVRALRSLGMHDVMLKWPNDVLLRHQKLAGTLVEIQGDVLGPSLAVVGVGINLRLDASTRERVDQAVTDVVSAGVTYDRNAVLGRVLLHLAEVLTAFRDSGFGPLRAEWESYHVHSERAVMVQLPDGRREEGTVAGVGDDGALLLQTRVGLRRFHSGEVSLRATSSDVRRHGLPRSSRA